MHDAFPVAAGKAVASRRAAGRPSWSSAAGPAASGSKRAFDVVVAAALLLLFAPLLLLLGVAVRLDSGGPALFLQRRTGLNGEVFRIYKLRTMRVAEDGAVVRQAVPNDSRVTRLGAFLRRSSLDELPQLLNVLKGEMSMVGPRPHALAHDEFYAGLLPTYAGRFRARPGLTGLAQVQGFRGEARDIGSMGRRVAADNAYIDTWSLGRDVKIMLRTLTVLWRDPNAY